MAEGEDYREEISEFEFDTPPMDYEDIPAELVPPDERQDIDKVEVRNLNPELIYTTNQKAEDFNKVPFSRAYRGKRNFNPPSPYKPNKPRKNDSGVTGSSAYCIKYPDDIACREYKKLQTFCEKNPNNPECKDPDLFCTANPDHPRCHDENNVYQAFGVFEERVRDVFDPEKRAKKVNEKPVQNLYESKQDDIQFETPRVIRSECRCKDGRIVLGYLNTRTGQKDCSPCNAQGFSNPSIYKNYRTKRQTKRQITDVNVPLRKQIGVSRFGDVNLKGCQTGNNNKSIEKINASATLNKVINTDTIDSRGGSIITAPQKLQGLPITLYDNASTNIYGV